MKDINLNELEDLLISIDEGALTIPELHGFLSAIIVGPEVVKPHIWLPIVFGLEEEMPGFSSIEEANNVCGAVIDFYNQIIRDMDTDEYTLILSAKRRKKRMYLILYPGVLTFLRAFI